MKILALNGSHRGSRGSTQRLLNWIAEGAREAGAEFEPILLAEKKIMPCAGCDTCHSPDIKLRCVYEDEDDVRAIFNKMAEADLLIYASPVYIFSITGIMKTFLDRFNSTAGSGKLCLTKGGLLFHKMDTDIYTKPFVVLTCCGNAEPETYKNVVEYFKTFSRFLDAPLVGTLIRTTVGFLDKEPESEKQKRLIEEVGQAYVEAGRELARQGKISPGTERQANQNLVGIPFFDFLMNFTFFKKMALKNAQKSPEGEETQ